MEGLALRCTRNIGKIEVRHDARRHGRSGYTLGKLIRLWLNMFVNFSVMPLRVSTLMGLAFSVVGFMLGLSVFVERMVRPDVPIGWATVVVAVVLFSGVQLIMLGLVGEYLGRLFLTSNQTPQFVVREVLEARSPTVLNPPHATALLAAQGNGMRTPGNA